CAQLPHTPLHSLPTRRSSDLRSVDRFATSVRSRPSNSPFNELTSGVACGEGCCQVASICGRVLASVLACDITLDPTSVIRTATRSEEHTSELQSLTNLVCRLL